jgi:hypothetical protein
MRKKRGAKLVVVDPKRTRIARDADLHIPLLPGTDVVLAYAVAALLEARAAWTGVHRRAHARRRCLPGGGRVSYPVEAGRGALRHRAPRASRPSPRCCASSAPAAMSIGVAPERNRNGSAGMRAAFS